MKLPRMKKRRDFLRAAQRGKRAGRPGMGIQALSATGGPLRLGFTVTKKVGNAVVRNRTKRRLREAARLVLGPTPPPGWDVVLIGRDETRRRPFQQLQGDLRGALRQLGVTPPSHPPAGPGP